MNFRSVVNLSFLSSDLAIDLGTANTLVYAKGKGIVVSEPSIVAVNRVTGKVEAVGRDAKDMLGRTPGNIVAIRPMKDGVIADFEITEKMLSHFIHRAHNRSTLVRPRIVIGIPSEVTQVEKRAVKDSALKAKASEVYLVDQAMAAAIGSSSSGRSRARMSRPPVPTPCSTCASEPAPIVRLYLRAKRSASSLYCSKRRRAL